MTGLNLSPQGVENRLRRTAVLPPGYDLRLEQTRPLHFPQAVFWFEATFVSDQKEQDLLTVAVDVHYGRQVRHLDRLLDRATSPINPGRHWPRHPTQGCVRPIRLPATASFEHSHRWQTLTIVSCTSDSTGSSSASIDITAT